MIIFEKEYDEETLLDIQDDIFDAVNKASLPEDEYGFRKGTFTVRVVWEDEE